MTETIITLPWPPSVNHYWRHVGHKVLISREGRQYRTAVAKYLTDQRAQGWGGALLEVQIDAYPPDLRRRDLDNLLKSVLDSLCHGGMYDDDSQIVELSIKKMDKSPPGKVVVRVTAA